jgi:LysM repeat protein
MHSMSYRVQPGDSLSGIAAHFHVTLSSLERANPQVRNPNLINVGQLLNVPGTSSTFHPAGPPRTPSHATSGTYVVRPGDSMSSIAGRLRVSLSALERANPQVRNPNLISVGQQLHVPGRTGNVSGPTGPTRVGGTVGQWISKAQAVLAAHGVPYRKMNAADIALIIHYESGGDPLAQNNWDSNARAGHPSIGLMQTIGPTFDAYKLPGHGNIRNPVDNIIAGVRYAISRYGSISNVPGVVLVHQGRGYVGY